MQTFTAGAHHGDNSWHKVLPRLPLSVLWLNESAAMVAQEEAKKELLQEWYYWAEERRQLVRANGRDGAIFMLYVSHFRPDILEFEVDCSDGVVDRSSIALGWLGSEVGRRVAHRGHTAPKRKALRESLEALVFLLPLALLYYLLGNW